MFTELLPKIERGETVASRPQSEEGRQYFSFPTPEEFRQFKDKGLKVMDYGEYLDLLAAYRTSA